MLIGEVIEGGNRYLLRPPVEVLAEVATGGLASVVAAHRASCSGETVDVEMIEREAAASISEALSNSTDPTDAVFARAGVYAGMLSGGTHVYAIPRQIDMN